MASNPLVSVIILNWDGKEYLANCFDSLYAGTFQDFEIIFSDNLSTDGSVDFVKTRYPQIRVIENDRRMGITLANNQAAALARGKYLFFLNNDIIADERLLEELVRTAEADPAIGICGCKTVSYHGHDLLNAGVPTDLFGYPFGAGQLFYVDAATFMRAGLFEKLGGFDERFQIYKEDVDLCWRVWLYGYRVVCVESAWFHHDSSCAPQKGDYKTTTRKRFLTEAHTLCMLLKNYSLPVLCLILPFYFLINLLEILAYGCFKGQWKEPLSIHSGALWWNLKNFGKTWRLRRKVQRERVVSDWVILRRLQKTSGKIALFRRIGLPQVQPRSSHYVD